MHRARNFECLRKSNKELSVNLTTEPIPGLNFKDPFMISSCHWTATENSLRSLVPFQPSALTLKTTSKVRGGSGGPDIGRRRKCKLEDSRGNNFASYTNGPATLELLDAAATHSLTCCARELLPESKVGLSVLQGEDYKGLAATLPPQNYAYVELNLKYSLRQLQVAELKTVCTDLQSDIKLFLEAFGSLPTFVKLPREATALLGLYDFQQIFSTIAEAKGGLIVANSRKAVVPPSRSSLPTLAELTQGVIVGEHLFLDTYNAIRCLTKDNEAETTIPPIVASGGIVDIGGALDILAVGASAVQLCSALDISGPQVLPLLREQLTTIATGYDSFQEFLQEMRRQASVWQQFAATARDLRVDTKTAVHRIFQEPVVMEHIENAIAEECTLSNDQASYDEPIAIPDGLQFVVSKGNVSTFLLANRVVELCSMLPIEFESAADFCRGLPSPAFHWDFAILPNSALDFVEKQKRVLPQNLLPQRIAAVGKSSIHLMGVHGLNLDGLGSVYHFTGNSARFALSCLLKECHPSTDSLIGPQLLPLLRCWNEEKAILAKPPLGFFYGMLCREQVKHKWSVIWSVSEPLILVASKALLDTRDGQKVAQAVAAKLIGQVRWVLQNPQRAAKRVRSEGFLDYCERMLLGISEGKTQ